MVRCVLIFSAIEALLSTDSNQVSDSLSRRVAAILVAEGRDRDAAIDKVKSLYDDRSRVVHGVRRIGEHPIDGSIAFKIAAHLIHAMFEWHAYQNRMGDLTSKQTFMAALRNAERTGQRMVGVPEDAARARNCNTKVR